MELPWENHYGSGSHYRGNSRKRQKKSTRQHQETKPFDLSVNGKRCVFHSDDTMNEPIERYLIDCTQMITGEQVDADGPTGLKKHIEDWSDIIHDPSNGNYIDGNEQSAQKSSRMYIDRYDVRNLLDDWSDLPHGIDPHRSLKSLESYLQECREMNQDYELNFERFGALPEYEIHFLTQKYMKQPPHNDEDKSKLEPNEKEPAFEIDEEFRDILPKDVVLVSIEFSSL